MARLRFNSGKEVKPNGVLRIRGVEINDIINTVPRNVIQNVFGEIAVRVNQANAMTQGDVLNEKVAQKRRLPRSGFANDVKMLPAVSRIKTE